MSLNGLFGLQPTEIEIAQVDVRGDGLWIEGNGFLNAASASLKRCC
jgi:hypothetical protein